MLIKKKSIRSLASYLSDFDEAEEFLVGVADLEFRKNVIWDIGFTKDISIGQQILPSVVGKISDFNANGKEIKRHDLPKITETRLVHSEWQDWHGSPHSGLVHRNYKVLQKELIPPPSIELRINQIKNGNTILCCGPFSKAINDESEILHAINLILELFGECEIFTGDGARIVGKQKVKRLNWDILPQGRYPWEKAKPIIENVIKTKDDSQKHVLRHNFKAITTHEPDFVAVGKGGFSGYLIFGFSKKSVYVLESTYMNNATYIFSENWKELSQLTKAEILQGNLQTDRVIHNRQWKYKINKLL